MTRAPRAGTAIAPTPWLEPDLLGKIVVARFLELPLRTFEQRVCRLEQEPCFHDLRRATYIGSLSGEPLMADRPAQDNVLGEVLWQDGRAVFRYASHAFDREYRFDEAAVEALTASARLVSRLRLVNTRNRLTHALLHALLQAQAEYLRTGDPLRLRSLSQARISARILAGGACTVVADPSRVSRLLRRLAIRTPSGEIAALRALCPTTREVHRHYVAEIIRRERVRMVEEVAPDPLTDRDIAETVRHEFGVRLSVRTVAYIRHDLGIPDYRERNRRAGYLTATVGFSPLFPLTHDILRHQVPPKAGVYEIRSPMADRRGCTIIYLGSARDLSKRLADHLRGYGGNERLRELLQAGDAWFRYRLVGENWRGVERAVYAAFCATFGVPPSCNRMSP